MGVVTYTTVNGEVLSEDRNGTRLDYVPNSLGSTVGLLDSTQSFTAKLTYWPYGEEVGTPYSGPQQLRYVGTLGCRKDGTSNRVAMGARALDTSPGQWMQREPLWPSGHAYAYANSSPASFADPSGLTPQKKVVKPAKESCDNLYNDCMACKTHIIRDLNKGVAIGQSFPGLGIVGGAGFAACTLKILDLDEQWEKECRDFQKNCYNSPEVYCSGLAKWDCHGFKHNSPPYNNCWDHVYNNCMSQFKKASRTSHGPYMPDLIFLCPKFWN